MDLLAFDAALHSLPCAHAVPSLLLVNMPISLVTGSGAYVMVDTAASPAIAANGTGATAPEQFIAVQPNATASITPIQPGGEAILRSVATGAYCRLAPTPANQSQIGVVCDQASAAAATPLTYTGNGLSHNGVPLAATVPGGPLLLANTTSSPTTSASEVLSFPSAPGGGSYCHCCALLFVPR
jgi:hypothetical protein